MGHSRLSGFTLIELMVALAVIAILAAMATPLYATHSRKTRRTDAMMALERVASAQEMRFLRTGSYTADLTVLGLASLSESGHYTIVVSQGEPGDFLAEVRPAPGSPQEGDFACQVFSIDHLGRKSALNEAGELSADCWR